MIRYLISFVSFFIYVNQLYAQIDSTLFFKAVKYNEQGDFGAAKLSIEGFISKYPNSFEAKKLKGRIYRNEGSYQESLDYLKNIKKDYRKEPYIYCEIGVLHAMQTDYKKAFKFYKKSLKNDKNHRCTYTSRGATYYLNNDYEKSLIDYNKALELDSLNKNGYYNRATTLFALSRYDEALSDFNIAFDAFPNDAMMLYARGNLKFIREDFDGALIDYEKAIKCSGNQHAKYDQLKPDDISFIECRINVCKNATKKSDY